MNRWILGARLRTLPAAIVPVAVGTAVAYSDIGTHFIWWRVVVVALVALSLQIGVNYANDYSDGIRGTDKKRVGPVRLVASGLAPASSVKRAAYIALGTGGLLGLLLALETSLVLLLVGILSIAAAWLYTGGSRPYGYYGYGELSVFIFFGVVATTGTSYVLLERISTLSLALSIPVGLLACALLIVNNLRDIPTDRSAGKKTLAVRIGDARTRLLYTTLYYIAGMSILFISLASGHTLLSIAAICPLIVSIPQQKAVMNGAKGKELIGVLGGTGRVQLITGLLLVFGLIFS